MLNALDRWVEKKILKRLHKKKQAILDNALQAFEKRYPGEPTAELRAKMEMEADRIYDFIGHSILKERLRRAKYYFWAVTFVTLAVAIGIFIATGASALIFISPAAAGIARWIVSVATIPISCNERVIGGMESVVNAWIRELEMNRDHEIKGDNTRKMIIELRAEVSRMQSELTELRNIHFPQALSGPQRSDQPEPNQADPEIKAEVEWSCAPIPV